MKRLILTTTGTVAGLAALLSFKTQTHPVANAATLPSAAATSSSAATISGAGSAPTSSVTNKTLQGSGSSASSSSSTHSTTGSAPKTYTGRAITTRYGVIQVKVTVANGKITHVAFVQLTAFDGRSQQINSNAAPQLLQETIQQQTAKVDAISGASYTSEGYRESLQSALDEAGLK